MYYPVHDLLEQTVGAEVHCGFVVVLSALTLAERRAIFPAHAWAPDGYLSLWAAAMDPVVEPTPTTLKSWYTRTFE